MLRLSIQIKFFCNAHKQDNETKNKKKKKKEKKKKKKKKKKRNKSVEVFTTMYSRLVTNPVPNPKRHGLTWVARIPSDSYFIHSISVYFLVT